MGGLSAQETEKLQLEMEKFDWTDIRTNTSLSKSTKVISGSRSEKEIADLPFTIYVVTGEEIRKNGYLTLVDVLKRLPGMRVSQPGSALEGETFLMRGLLGNTYAKILINDIPIKPFIVNGMPIGAQLPIREAERIEVIYGPAATLYGADASAGVINIILKDSDRPIYVQADMGFGWDGFENLDIMFGGKTGKGKNVFTFKVLGNFTTFDDRRIKYDLDSLYNPDVYQQLLGTDDFSYLDRSNYNGTKGSPILNNLPHLSHALGVEFNYRNWELSILRFGRRDHSSLGLSPYVASYTNPLNFFGERITNVQLNYSKKIKRLDVKAGIGLLDYRTDDRSSYSYVRPLLNIIQNTLIDEDHPDQDSLSQLIDDRYFSGSRFSSASSIEFNAETVIRYKANKNLEFASGFSLNAGAGDPLLNFSPIPLNNSEEFGIVNEVTSYTDLSSFVECYFNYNKWNAIFGLQAFSRQTDYLLRDKFVYNPRVAFQYKWTSAFSLRAAFGKSIRYPSPYYSATTYSVKVLENDFLKTGASLSPEETYSYDFGCRLDIGDKINTDVTAYYTRTTNLINYSLDIDNQAQSFILGYSNDENTFAELYGLQASISFINLVEEIGLNGRINMNYSQGKEVLNVFSFDQGNDILLEIDGVRSQPDWIFQVDVEVEPFERARLLLENTLMTKSWTRNSLLYQFSEQIPSHQLQNPGFYTLDMMMNYQFNRHLLAFIKCTNIFNREYAGIDATADSDGLIYAPQSQRNLRVGLNYRLH